MTSNVNISIRPQACEINIAKRIVAYRSSLLETFRKIDLDGDNQITKENLSFTLYNIFNIRLTEEELDRMIENMKCYAGPDGIINWPVFNNYINYTVDARPYSSGSDLSRSIHSAGSCSSVSKNESKLPVTYQKSKTARARELRRIVYNLIQQSAPSQGEGGMASTHSFMSMDTGKDNNITRAEFRSWLKLKMNLDLSVEEMDMVIGQDWKEADDNYGISLPQFITFVDCLQGDTCERRDTVSSRTASGSRDA